MSTRSLSTQLKAGDIVVIDNLGSHKDAAVQRRPSRPPARSCSGTSALQSPISTRSKPPSPSSTPISLRKAAEPTVEQLWDKIGALLAEFSPTECASYFAAAGYDPV